MLHPTRSYLWCLFSCLLSPLPLFPLITQTNNFQKPHPTSLSYSRPSWLFLYSSCLFSSCPSAFSHPFFILRSALQLTHDRIRETSSHLRRSNDRDLSLSYSPRTADLIDPSAARPRLELTTSLCCWVKSRLVPRHFPTYLVSYRLFVILNQ